MAEDQTKASEAAYRDKMIRASTSHYLGKEVPLAEPPAKEPTAEAEAERAEANARAARQRALEAEIEAEMQFNLGVSDYVAAHAGVLPVACADIVKAANEIEYERCADKAFAIRDSLIAVLFEVPDNRGALTPAQKRALNEYQTLPRADRRAKALDVYRNIFEPTVARLAAVKAVSEPQLTAEEKRRRMAIERAEQHFLGRG